MPWTPAPELVEGRRSDEVEISYAIAPVGRLDFVAIIGLTHPDTSGIIPVVNYRSGLCWISLISPSLT